MQPIPHWAAVIGMVALALTASPARAQDYPTRTVTIVAPSAPGGMYSILARLIGGKLEQLYGKSFVVENRPGASSVTGAVAVIARAARRLHAHGRDQFDPGDQRHPAQEPALRSAHRFRSDHADRAVPEVLLVNASLPVRSIADLVALARTTPGGLSFGSAGPGTAQHLNGELLKATLDIEMHHVPYKGIQPALNDLAGGHIALMTAPIPVALPLVQGGRARMLGLTTKERVGAITDVPSLAEIGVPGYNAPSWFMLVAPATTPQVIVDKLHADLRAVLGAADVREEFILRQGLIPVDSPPPDQLKAFVRSRDRPAGRHREESRLDRVAVGSDRDGSS